MSTIPTRIPTSRLQIMRDAAREFQGVALVTERGLSRTLAETGLTSLRAFINMALSDAGLPPLSDAECREQGIA